MHFDEEFAFWRTVEALKIKGIELRHEDLPLHRLMFQCGYSFAKSLGNGKELRMGISKTLRDHAKLLDKSSRI